MKAILTILASVTLGFFSFAAEEDPMRFSVRGDLNRAKTYFSIVTNLDNKQFAAAEALFKTLPSTNGWGGFYYERISRHFLKHEYVDARDLCLCDIHFWIIDTAADWQVPALTTLLNHADRLDFLQSLAAYCEKFPARTEHGRESEASVARILRIVPERKKDEKK
jgi:hypothetical protein